MNTDKFMRVCIQAIKQYVQDHMDKTDDIIVKDSDIYNVWNVKVLKNNKGLFSTIYPDGMYYECTYNGETSELYLDAYKKFENRTIVID
jgi:hypothetical protein